MALTPKEMAKRVVEESWRNGGECIRLEVSGGSMGRTIPPGSTVVVRFGRRPRVKRGCLIYFRRGERRIVHRLVLNLGLLFVEKGDAIYGIGLCMRSQVLGVVASIIRK